MKESQDVVVELQATGLTRVRHQAPMRGHTSWRVGGPAEFLATAETPDAIKAGAAYANSAGMAWVVLGGGSNILVSDQGISGLVIINRTKSTRILRLNREYAVDAGSGVFFARLAMHTAKQGYTGLEWGVAIPGTVGAGVVNNAGAHGGSVEHSLLFAEAVDERGHDLSFLPSDLHFSYRQSILKTIQQSPITQSRTVVTKARFRLESCDSESATAHIRELVRTRQDSQPINEHSAGSTFKNPLSGSAGYYIEQSGLKGFVRGGATVSRKHGNFITSEESCTASDILHVIRHVQFTVFERFGIRLEPEVQLVGNWPAQATTAGWDSGVAAAQ